jgi:ABC-type antimicrobial peptide transport system permease subunit
MFRFLLRLAGLLSFAGAFAALVIDGTRSLAGGRVLLTPLADFLASRIGLIERSTLSLHPLLWDPITTTVLKLPIWCVLAVIGLALMQMGRSPAPLIGYSDR